jgi:sugar phosphate isomerase/epimerase
MKLATTTGDFGQYASSQEECMEYIAQSGFKYIDYNFGMDYDRRIGVFSEDWKGYLENVKRKADELGVTFVQAHSPMGKPLAPGNEAFTEDTKRCIESCAELGIPNIVVHSGYIHKLTKEEAFERNKVFFMELLRFAEKYNVNVLVENFNKMCVEGLYWIDNAPDLRALIDYVDHPLFHACWDAGHGNMQEMPQDEALRILGEHVYALHIQDNLGTADSHIAPFCGSLNLDAVMHGLKDIDYKGYFTFESGNILLPASYRRPFEKDQRLAKAPLGLRIKAENLLYEMGKYILDAYDCFEE